MPEQLPTRRLGTDSLYRITNADDSSKTERFETETTANLIIELVITPISRVC